VRAAEQRFPHAWPEDLRRWYALQNGAAWDSANTPLPDWRILSLAEMLETSEMFAGFFGGDDGNVVRDGERDEAGSIAFAFLPSFVPIGDNIAACYLFVDTRPGPAFGCVSDWDRDEGALDEPTWPSITAMLEDVADAVRNGRASNGWAPTVVDGELTWELVQEPPDAWDIVRELYFQWRDLAYEFHEVRPQGKSRDARAWSDARQAGWPAVDLVENIVANCAFHHHLPLDDWPAGAVDELRRGVARLRADLPGRPAGDRPFFETTIRLAEAALAAASGTGGGAAGQLSTAST
jgi:cell wall assembly regulator SMI1